MTSEANMQSAQLVLDGNFNPYLVSPEWIGKQDIWVSKNVRLALGAIKDGVQFQDESTEWSVSSNHLAISSVECDCGSMASKVLKELPHTPIKSVRADFVFHNDSDDGSSPIFTPLASGPLKSLSADLLTAGAIFHRENVRVEVRLVKGAEGVTVSVHFFRHTPNVETAVSAVEAFEEDKKESLDIITSILGDTQ